MTRIGLIADTHGLLRPEALTALAGADVILHAGDIGGAAILDALRAIAPVHAVRGNNDTGAWAEGLSHSLRLEFGLEGRREEGSSNWCLLPACGEKVAEGRMRGSARANRPESGGVTVLLVHDVADAVPDGANVVVSGHSHRPGVTRRDGVLWVNPGSAGPRRFRLPVSVGWLHVGAGDATAETVDLVVPPAR